MEETITPADLRALAERLRAMATLLEISAADLREAARCVEGWAALLGIGRPKWRVTYGVNFARLHSDMDNGYDTPLEAVEAAKP